MCGRFVSTHQPDRIAAYFDAEVATDSLGENYNVAPTQDVYGVVTGDDGTRRVEAFHWGLVPSWAKDRRIASRMINARAETLAEKPAFRGLLAKKRCLVPMDGFYEWMPGDPDGPLTKRGKPVKQPMYIHRSDGDLLAVAGLWTAWKDPADPEGRWLHSTTIVTTAANELMAPIHDRMPAIVPEDRWATWLDPTNHDTVELQSILLPSGEELVVDPASTDVNNVRNNSPDLLRPR
jgi:putative SOS response-associated peptidase YedK